MTDAVSRCIFYPSHFAKVNNYTQKENTQFKKNKTVKKKKKQTSWRGCLKNGITNTGTAFFLKLSKNKTENRVYIFKLQCNQEHLLSLLNVRSSREECVRSAGVTHARRQRLNHARGACIRKTRKDRQANHLWQENIMSGNRSSALFKSSITLKGSWNLQLKQRFSHWEDQTLLG